jgi:polar amino acid transport system substrate-binding protein
VLPGTADSLDEVKARGKIIVGVSDTTPPFTFKRPGKGDHVGYDIDLMRAVAKRLGVAVETVSLSSAERIPMLQQGKLDFVTTSMTRTPDGARRFGGVERPTRRNSMGQMVQRVRHG